MTEDPQITKLRKKQLLEVNEEIGQVLRRLAILRETRNALDTDPYRVPRRRDQSPTQQRLYRCKKCGGQLDEVSL